MLTDALIEESLRGNKPASEQNDNEDAGELPASQNQKHAPHKRRATS
jgi:hypothetical protein